MCLIAYVWKVMESEVLKRLVELRVSIADDCSLVRVDGAQGSLFFSPLPTLP